MNFKPLTLVALVGVALGSPGLGQTGAVDVVLVQPDGAESQRIAGVERGQRVSLSGIVVRVIDRGEFRLEDGSGSITVHLPWTGPSIVEVGDEVRVEGIVDDDRTFGVARPELYATSLHLSDGVTMQFAEPPPRRESRDNFGDQRADSLGASPIASVRRGESAAISGTVVGILDSDEFRLEDKSGSVRVYIGWRNRMPVNVGDRVTVSGVLDDDPWPLLPEFYASAILTDDGRSFDLRRVDDVAEHRVAPESRLAAPSFDERPRDRTLIKDIRPFDVVLLEGVVDRITDEDEFRIRDESGSVRVYIGWRNTMPVQQGERVSLVGIVDSKGVDGLFREVYAYQLTTGDGRVIQLQTSPRAVPADSRAPVDAQANDRDRVTANVTPIRDVRRGQSVTLTGEVTRIRDTDEFVLRDQSGSIRIYIGWRNRMPVRTGDRVTVIGTADDDVFPGMRPEIYASRIEMPDGRVIQLERGGYEY